MAKQTLPIVEYDRKELILANGPFNVARTGNLVVITFTQVRARADSMVDTGVGKLSYEAVVMCRVALHPQNARELARIIGDLNLLDTQTAGSG